MNRFSRTGFTAREQETLDRCIDKINPIFQRRRDKQDDPEALANLLKAISNLQTAQILAYKWTDATERL